MVSFKSNFALTESYSVIDHNTVLLQSDLLYLEVLSLLSEEVHLVDIVLLVFPEILLEVVNVLQDFLQNVV